MKKNWFTLHPNWIVFIMWIVAIAFLNLMVVIGIDANSSVWWLILAVVILMVWGALAWSLVIKKRSMINLLYLLIPFVGMLIVWGLGNKSGKMDNKAEQEKK